MFEPAKGQIHFESVHEQCHGNTATVININLILDKDMDISKVKEIIREAALHTPISISRGGI